MAAAAGLLTLAQLQIAAQIQLLGHLVKALLAHQRCPDPGQIPLRQVRVPGEEILRRHKAQHAVAQKLQPFVAAKPLGAMLIRVGAVIQRLPQQFLVPEEMCIRDSFLGFPRTPFTRKGYAASVKRYSR